MAFFYQKETFFVKQNLLIKPVKNLPWGHLSFPKHFELIGSAVLTSIGYTQS